MELITFDDLSLNVLDIAFNSVKAGASCIRILITVNTRSDTLDIAVWDNGSGFNVKEYEKNMASVPQKSGGKGLPLFKESAEKTGGSFYIMSKPDEGTFASASYVLNSPHRAPLGDMGETIAALALCEGLRIVYTYMVNDAVFSLDTEEISEILGTAPAKCPEAIKFIKDFIRENTDFINKKNFLKG